MKVIVTGGLGFIGSHLADRLLSLGNFVTIVDNFSSGRLQFLEKKLRNPRLKIIKTDLLDEKRLLNIFIGHDFVFHLAANPDIAKGIDDPSLDFKQTIIATFNVLQAMRINSIKKIFYTSGSGVYGDLGERYSKEDFGPLLPVSMYGASKLSAEALISAFSHLFGFQAWIVRPANIIGPRATHGVIFDFINKLKNNPENLKILGDGKQSKSYLYVVDVINAIFLILNKAQERINLFNLASEDFIDVNSIANIIIEKMNLKRVKITYTGGPIGWKGDVPIVRINSEKIRKLGWFPKYNSKKAVEKTVEELLKSHNYE